MVITSPSDMEVASEKSLTRMNDFVARPNIVALVDMDRCLPPRYTEDRNKENRELYACKNVVIGTVGPKGGELSFSDKSVSVKIPEGALSKPILMHCYRDVGQAVTGENTDLSGPRLIQYSPMFDFGPDGTIFQKLIITVRFRHSVSKKEWSNGYAKKLKVHHANNGGSRWKRDDTEQCRLDGEWMKITLDHFGTKPESESLRQQETLEYVQNSCAAGVIGPQGSNLYFANYSLTVPRDALSAPAIITFTRPLRSAAENGIYNQDKRPLVQMSPTIRCGPDGTKFDKPVTIRCPHTMSNLTCPKMLKVYTRGSDNEWRWDKAGSVKVMNRSLEIQIDHFSDVMVAIDLDELVGAEGGEELPTIDIMLSTMMTRDSAGHLQMHLVITPDNANDHKSFRASLYHQCGNETTRFSEPTRVEEISPQTAINFQLLNPVTSAVIQTRVTSDGIVSQLTGQCQVEPFDLGPNTTTCNVRLSQAGPSNPNQFTAALNDHFPHEVTALEAFEFSRSEPEETFDELHPTVIRAIEEIQSSKPCCMMCQTKQVNVVLLKCGHVDLCEDCAGSVYECPKCCDYIAQRVKVQC